MLDDGGVLFEVTGFDGVKSFCGKVKSLEGEVGDDKGSESDSEEQKFKDGVHRFEWFSGVAQGANTVEVT